jgi:hypothetical protein
MTIYDTHAEKPLTRANTRRWKFLAFAAGSISLAAGLFMEYAPLVGSHTIPQANAVCSGAMGLFVQGMAKAFGTKTEAAQVSQACSASTMAEHFIGPLIMLGVAGLVIGTVLVIAERRSV